MCALVMFSLVSECVLVERRRIRVAMIMSNVSLFIGAVIGHKPGAFGAGFRDIGFGVRCGLQAVANGWAEEVRVWVSNS